MTVLPSSPGPTRPDRRSLSTRAIAAIVVVALIAVGVLVWFLRPHHGDGSSAAASRSLQSRPAKPVVDRRIADNVALSKAAMVAAAKSVFAALPAQLPGWQASGKTAIQTDTDDPTSRAIARCLGARGYRSTEVDSPTYANGPIFIGGLLSIFRNSAAAHGDLASAVKTAAVPCLRQVLAGKRNSIGHGTYLTLRTVRRLSSLTAGQVGFQFDGDLSGRVEAPFRIVIVFVTVGRTEVGVVASGADEAPSTSVATGLLVTLADSARNVFVSDPAGIAVASSPCVQAAPAGASAQARSYLEAVNADYPRWIALDRKLVAQQRVATRGDMSTAAAIDSDFLARLSQLHMSGRAADHLEVLETTLSAYVQLLRSGAQHDGYLHAHSDEDGQLSEARAEASAALRQDLGLPPSTCVLLRP